MAAAAAKKKPKPDSARQAERPPVGNLTDLSPSRVRTATVCGLKFRYSYIDQIPAPLDRASSIFGSVVHNGVHEWYGLDGQDNAERHQEMDLPTIVAEQWPRWLPQEIWTPTVKTIEAAIELDNMESYIRLTRPKIKGPRQTKQFLESKQYQDFVDQENALKEVCDKREDIKWPKDEYPFKAYTRSLEIANRVQNLWRPLPRPLAVERPFMLQFEGLTIKGAMDQLRLDPLGPSGEVVPDLRDLKTGRQLFTQMELFIQAFLYYEACRQAEDLPTPEKVTFDILRQGKLQNIAIDYERHKKIAIRLLHHTIDKINSGVFEPAYSGECKMCDYRLICEEELNLWKPGTDGLTVELA